jgi:hypothetical protein
MDSKARPNRVIEDADLTSLTHPKPPKKYSDSHSPSDYSQPFFILWYTIYECI